MALDPNNPSTPVDPSLLDWRTKSIAVGERQATAMEQMVAVESGSPVTESAIYLAILCACIKGNVATNSTDMQIWATDLTKDYVAKYPLTSGSVPLPPVTKV